MPVRIYAHLTWTTFARLPLIDTATAAFLEKFLAAEAWYTIARAYLVIGKLDRAEEAFKNILSVNPTYATLQKVDLLAGLHGVAGDLAVLGGHAGVVGGERRPEPDRLAQGVEEEGFVGGFRRGGGNVADGAAVTLRVGQVLHQILPLGLRRPAKRHKWRMV